MSPDATLIRRLPLAVMAKPRGETRDDTAASPIFVSDVPVMPLMSVAVVPVGVTVRTL
jgi:CRISPR/Cas system CMR-associated protein Cmr1 (group 7 of RAMP superfamily)